MSATAHEIDARLLGNLYRQDAAGTTPDLDVAEGACDLFAITVNNGATEAAHVKVHDNLSVASTGVDAPTLAFVMPASTTRTIFVVTEEDGGGGLPFANGLSFRVSDNLMVTSGTDGDTPSGGSVDITVVTN